MLAAALVAALACPAQPALIQREHGRVIRTAVVACHRGRRVVVRRARLLRPRGALPVGRVIKDVASAGPRVAWTELRYAGDVIGTVHLRRIAGGRPGKRRVFGHDGHLLSNVSVVLTTRGELGWLVGGTVATAPSIKARDRTVKAFNASRLRLDDDRTLRWWDHELETWEFADVRPWPGGGCPVRSRFEVVAESPEVVATEGDYTFLGEPVPIVRACVRATGADPVIAQSFVESAGGEHLRVAGVSGPWVVLLRTVAEGADDCVRSSIEVYDPATDRYGRGAVTLDCHDAPTRGAPLAVTARGVPAWIVRNAARSRLMATVRGEGPTVAELDAGGRGAITGLTAEGTVVRWLHDGEPRSLDLG